MGRRLEQLQFEATYFPVVVASCLFFLSLFRYVSPKLSSKLCEKYKTLSPIEKVDWDTRVGSTVHSLVVSCVCVYSMVYDDEITKEPIWWDAPVVRTSCAIVVGYLSSDIIVMAVYKDIGDYSYFLHHGVSIYAYYYVTAFGVLPYFANYRLVAEVSTPIVNQRWFLSKLGYDKSSSIATVNGMLMLVVFFVVRIAVMPSYWLRVYHVFDTTGFIQLGYIRLCMIVPCLVLDILNIGWFYKICMGAYGIMSKAVKKTSEGDKATQSLNLKNTSLYRFANERLMHYYVDDQKQIN